MNRVEQSDKHIVVELVEQLLDNAMSFNCSTTDFVADDAVWVAQNGRDFVTKKEADEYTRRIIPTFGDYNSFHISNVQELNSECVSVTGIISFSKNRTYFEGVDICFNINFVLEDGRWMFKHITTSSGKRMFGSILEDASLNFDLGELYDDFPSGIMGCDIYSQFKIKMMNPIMLSLLGYSSLDELKDTSGASLYALIHPDDLQEMQDFVKEIVESGTDEIRHFRVRKKDFSYIWLQIAGNVFHERMVILISMDYTEQQKRTERLLKENEAVLYSQDSLRRVLSNTPGGFHRCALSEPVHVEYVSDNLCQLTQYSSKEILEDMNGVFIELIEPDDRYIFINAIKSLMEYPHTEQIEYRIKKKDGTSCLVYDTIRSIRHDDGKLYAYALIIDVSKMRSTKELYEIEPNELPLGYCIYHYKGGHNFSTRYINDEFCRMIGYTKEEYAKMSEESIYPLVFDEDCDILEEALRELLNGGEEASCRVRLHKIKGAAWVNATFRLLADTDDDGTIISAYIQEVNSSAEVNEANATSQSDNSSQRHIVEIKTFGYFTVFVDHKPIHFRSEKAKELLAVLVDYRGILVNQGAIISRLWEDEPVNNVTLARLRKTFKTLVDELKTYDIDYIVESERGARRIIPEQVYCDLFSYQTGKPQFQFLFQGSYMMDYSWAESTLFDLEDLKSQYEEKWGGVTHK